MRWHLALVAIKTSTGRVGTVKTVMSSVSRSWLIGKIGERASQLERSIRSRGGQPTREYLSANTVMVVSPTQDAEFSFFLYECIRPSLGPDCCEHCYGIEREGEEEA